MKRTISALFLFLLSAIGTFAQHSATLNWQASPTAGLAGYAIYRAPCTGTVSGNTCSAEGTFAKLSVVSALTYTDTTVTGGSLYSYYVTAVCPSAGCSSSISGESVGSNHIGIIVPKDPPQPPAGLTITTVSKSSTGANTTLSANWTTTPNIQTTYTFMSSGQVLGRGSQVNTTGAYTAGWIGKLKPGSNVVFQACDTNNSCDSRMM